MKVVYWISITGIVWTIGLTFAVKTKIHTVNEAILNGMGVAMGTGSTLLQFRKEISSGIDHNQEKK